MPLDWQYGMEQSMVPPQISITFYYMLETSDFGLGDKKWQQTECREMRWWWKVQHHSIADSCAFCLVQNTPQPLYYLDIWWTYEQQMSRLVWPVGIFQNGDLAEEARSFQLTAFPPRWAPLSFKVECLISSDRRWKEACCRFFWNPGFQTSWTSFFSSSSKARWRSPNSPHTADLGNVYLETFLQIKWGGRCTSEWDIIPNDLQLYEMRRFFNSGPLLNDCPFALPRLAVNGFLASTSAGLFLICARKLQWPLFIWTSDQSLPRSPQVLPTPLPPFFSRLEPGKAAAESRTSCHSNLLAVSSEYLTAPWCWFLRLGGRRRGGKEVKEGYCALR